VVDRVRRVLGTRAVGHAGTLDPFATGLLVVLIGRATRLARFVEREDKEYLAEAVLGVATETDDATGDVLAEHRPDRWPGRGEIEEALGELRGTYPQRPPAYSARRTAGRRGYELARRGQGVDLPATPVTVRTLDPLEWSPPVLVFRAVVSPGTYVRALARDLGERLALGGHLRALRRERIGTFRVADAVALDAVAPETRLLTPLELLPSMRRWPLTGEQARAAGHGQVVPAEAAVGEAALVSREDRLVAVAEGNGNGWQPRVVLEPA